MSLGFLLRRGSAASLLWGVAAVAVGPINAAKADDAPTSGADPVIVSATRLATPQSEVASSVTLVTSEEIEAKQAKTLQDVLMDVPGVEMPSYGGPGTSTYLFTRGTNANHTKVLVDGIDISDPGQSDGSANLENILASDIERIEMLRGPQSGLYGSDAIGGVLNIVTKKGAGPLKLTATIEGGSFGTFNQAGSASGSTDKINYAFNVDHYSAQSMEVEPDYKVKPGNQRQDYAYDNKGASGKFGIQVADNTDVGLVLRGGESRLNYLGTSGSYMTGAHDYQTDTQFMTRGTVHNTLFDNRFDQTLGISFKDEHRHYADSSDQNAAPTVYGGYSEKIDWQGNVKVVPGQTVTMGAERSIQSIDNLKPEQFTANTGNTAGFLQLQSKFGEHFADTVSIRRDENDQFGGANTYRVAPAVLIPETGSKIKGSIGTGFKAPSLDQLYDNYPSYSFYANSNLKPEKSLGYDFGFDQQLLSDKLQFGSTYFHNNIKNLIVTVYDASWNGTYENVSSAVTKGFENYISYQPLERLIVKANYTYTLTENLSSNRQLVERPKHKVGFSSIWQATDDLRLTISETGTSNWYAYNYAKGSGWWITNLTADYKINENLSVFGRVNNLFDRKYAMQTDYLAPSLGVFGGVKVSY